MKIEITVYKVMGLIALGYAVWCVLSGKMYIRRFPLITFHEHPLIFGFFIVLLVFAGCGALVLSFRKNA